MTVQGADAREAESLLVDAGATNVRVFAIEPEPVGATARREGDPL